jgi:predicted ribosomally synthesized peptide with SipW-like signal peptide
MIIDRQKKKLAAGAVAGVAALALIGGGTFALWSDFDVVENNTLSAGTLVLDVGQSAPLSMTGLAPGENKETTIFIANRSDDTAALQNARLTTTVTNLVDVEDGCPANSEQQVDTTCNPGNGAGEFTREAYMQYRVSNAVTPDDCRGATYTNRAWQVLSSYDDGPINLGELDPLQGICVVVEVGLPSGQGSNTPPPGIDAPNAPGATNLSQGDGATFDVRFDLTQATPTR